MQKKVNKTRNRRILIASTLIVSLLALCASEFLWNYNLNILSKSLWIKILNPAWIVVIVCLVWLIQRAYYRKNYIINMIPLFIFTVAFIGFEIATWFIEGIKIYHSGYLTILSEALFLIWISDTFINATIKNNIDKLSVYCGILQKKINVKIKNHYVEAPIDSIKVGDIIFVQNNCVIAADGVLLGDATVDESIIFGQGCVNSKKCGDLVFGGSIVKNDVEIRIEKIKNTALQQIAFEMNNASKKETNISVKVNKFINFSPITISILIAIVVAICLILTFYFKKLLVAKDIIKAILTGLSIIIVVSPIALSQSIPSTFKRARMAVYKKGIIIRNENGFETLSNANYICFDKTGIITDANQYVDSFYTEIDETEFWQYIAASERGWNNRIAKLLCEYKPNINNKTAKSQVFIDGLGVEAIFSELKDGVLTTSAVKVAKWSAFISSFAKKDCEATGAMHVEATKRLKEGNTVIGMELNGKLIGVISIKDTLRSSAASAVTQLKSLRVHTLMLSGDNAHTITAAALATGIEEYRSGLNSKNKAEVIKSYKKDGKTIIMVSDGIDNDECKNIADCYVLMNGIQGNKNFDNADIIVANDDFSKIPQAITIGRKAISRIKNNLIAAIIAIIVAIAIGIFGYMSPIIAAFINILFCWILSINRPL
ncbi:MAG: HAD-IC family P-type ATPase [Clostridia bacterium]